MFGVDPDIGNSALRLWVAAGSAALLVSVCALAFDWTRTRTVARVSVVVLGAVLGATLAWAFLDAASVRDHSAERRALEMRAAELNAQSLAPGSPLACLNGLAGEDVEAACEKALFAAPATVAAATSYVAARLALLADMVAYIKRGGANIDNALLPLRHSLEADRFGFVAHVLAMRDGCSSDNCKALALLHDPSRVRANLSGQTLDRYLDHYLAAWAQAPDVPLADAHVAVIRDGRTGCPGPAQGYGRYRLSHRGLDSADQHHEPRAAGAAGCRRRRSRGGRRSEGPRCTGIVGAAIAQAGRQSAGSSRRFSTGFGRPVDPVWTPAARRPRLPRRLRHRRRGAGAAQSVPAAAAGQRRWSGARAVS